MDLALESTGHESDRQVNGGEARADQENTGALIQTFQGLSRQRNRNIPVGFALRSQRWRITRRQVARGDYNRVSHEFLATLQLSMIRA